MGEEAKRVLLVEDIEPVRELISQVLSRFGYVVHCAEDAEQALTTAERLDRLDLLLADIELPGLKGTELYNKLSRRRPGMKVLFMSGYSEEILDGILQRSNDIPFIQKPFTPQQLLEKVKDVFGKPGTA